MIFPFSFTARCPLSPREQAWIETRMQWFAERLGVSRLIQAATATPSPEFFSSYPEDGLASMHDVQRILEQVQNVMGVGVEQPPLEIHDDDAPPTPSDTLRVPESHLADPSLLAATLAHESARSFLFSAGHLTSEEPSLQWTVGLATIYMGMGVFTANAVLHETYISEGYYSFWRIQKLGHLPARITGYGLALYAWARNEQQPAWMSYLRSDALLSFRGGRRYLNRSGSDSLFQPHTPRPPRGNPSPIETLAALRKGARHSKIAALWDLQHLPSLDQSLAEVTIGCLGDRDPEVRQEALTALAFFDPAQIAPAAPQVFDALQDHRTAIRAAAAFAIGVLQLDPATALEELAALLSDGDNQVIISAAAALKQFGPNAEPAAPALMKALKPAVTACDGDRIAAINTALAAVCSEPLSLANEVYGDSDPELREQIRQVVSSEHSDEN